MRLRRLLRLRTRELRQLRRLAQEVLLQRSDVEAFLVSSIQHARAEMVKAASGAAGGQPAMAAVGTTAGSPAAARPAAVALLLGSDTADLGRAAAHTAAATAATAGGLAAEHSRPRAGSVVSQPSAAHPAGAALGAVDIRDLSWDDRERILRFLFAKINKAAQQTPAAPAAQPVLEAEAEAPLLPLRGLATEAGPASLA